ncbi:peptidoglycan/LPS O-acetylase OafA/YrhL [Arthrobacter sp. SLBN-53]|nr:peptidoglycan/LPS O-acetylase OafA/YrhL [Arthrobacter sp. SLBN-53]
MHHRPDLQGMRAVAVLVVFANHLFDWPSGGFVGVDIFFVLSGFFITGILIRERTETRTLSFQNFYARRAKRILPSALLVITITVTAGFFLFPATRARATLIDGLYAAIFASNWRFQAVGADYFQQTQPPSPLQHYWSLSIEEQFYFIWPILLFAIFAATRRAMTRGRAATRQWGLFGSMLAIAVLSAAWAMYQTLTDPNSAYFSTFTRIWELGIGALLAIAGVWLARIPDQYRPALAYLGLAGVAASLFLINETSLFPAPWVALPVLSTALVVASFHGVEVRAVPLLTNPVARWFGDTSYTLYLWHWPVIMLLLAVIPRDTAFYVLAVVLPLGLTALTYHFYENPIRQSDWLTPGDRDVPWYNSPRFYAGIGALTAAAVALSIAGMWRADQQAEILANTHSRYSAATTTEPVDYPCLGSAAMVTPGCPIFDPNEPVRPSIDHFADDNGGAFECYQEEDDPQMRSCTYGYEGAGAVRIAVVGDSHAAALLPGLLPSLGQNKWNLTTYIGFRCQWRLPAYDDECDVAEIQDKLIAERYDVVVTTAYRIYGGDRQVFANAWEPVIAAGSRLVVVSDNPANTEDAISCVSRVGSNIVNCGNPTSVGFKNPDPLMDAAGPNVTVVDLRKFFCKGDRCPSVIGNVIVYRDTDHVTATYMSTLTRELEGGIKQALSAQRPTR